MSGLEKVSKFLEDGKTKVVVVDESGEPKFVIMSLSAYFELSDDSRIDGLSRKMADLTRQAEDLNRQISQAQMEDLDAVAQEKEVDEATSEQKEDSFYIEPLTDQLD